MSKIILFSTRFLENEDYLFSIGNYDNNNIKSSEFKNYFLSKEALLSIGVNIDTINYLNRIFCFQFFEQYKDDSNMPLINIEDSYQMIRDKIKEIISQEQRKSLADTIRKFNENIEKKLLAIKICEGKFSVEGADDKNMDSYYNGILRFEGQSINQDVILNTDFGDAIGKRTIDRRFKIYKLRTENSKDYSNYSVYAIWCLSKGSSTKAANWYKALYEELKSQLGQEEFNKVEEILYFLHDGDIDAKKPFDVISYKETNTNFSFLDDNKKLSIAIFDHSNSQVAKALRTPDVDKAIKMVVDAMEEGGIQSFLYDLMDCISRWTAEDENGKTGKKEYEELTEEIKLNIFSNDIVLKYTSKEKNVEGTPVSRIYEDVKQQIESISLRKHREVSF